ncbi:hypothetical protein [Flavobacterium sp.]|uniref:hypothetical protein n=1 Tax=Flavobacterium sp. TaxID=239 RepID=UPI00286DA12F|nr:hypothetical protein [Flavobacterium sp.]
MYYRFFCNFLLIAILFSCDNTEILLDAPTTIIPSPIATAKRASPAATTIVPKIWTKGIGTISDPYQIEIPEHLVYLSKAVNESSTDPYSADYTLKRFANKYFKIMSDLNLKNIPFIPIGKVPVLTFLGNLDGNFKKISNLKIKTTNNLELSGLFGCMGFTTSVKNLSIINGNIEGINYVGGIAGKIGANSKIENCSYDGIIRGIDFVGGIIGGGNSDINSGDILNSCSFNGSIVGNKYVGGIIGSVDSNSQINRCFNKGNIKGSAKVGGIVGDKYDCVVNQCYNIGTVMATTASAGGIIGVSNGYASLGVKSDVFNCYNRGEISAPSSAAGIIGTQIKGSVHNSYNTGKISMPSEYNNPIAKGYDYSWNEVDNCYYLNSSITLDSKSGLIRGISKEQNFMLTISFVNDLNKNILPNAWKQDKIPNTNGGYPILSWQ